MFRSCLCLLMLLTLLLTACKPPEGADARKRSIVATTTMIEDLARQIAGDRFKVIGLLPAGADPHTYSLEPNDAKAIAQSSLVLMNGLGLEGSTEGVVKNAGEKTVVREISEGMTPLDDPMHPGNPDPHIWFDVRNWIIATGNVKKALIETDPAGKDIYTKRAKTYIEALEALDTRTRRAIACIPESKRHLVTSHDAFQYYGEAYGIGLKSVLGINTAVASGANRNQAELIDFVREKQLPAIFGESSVSDKAIRVISAETGATVKGPLFSDSVGTTPGTRTYIGMVDANTRMIVEALSGRSLETCLSGNNDAPK